MNDKFKNRVYVRMRDILLGKNYQIIRVVQDKNPNAPEIQFEFWAGAKGVIILQIWGPMGGDEKTEVGVATYCNWGTLGSTFEDLEKAI